MAVIHGWYGIAAIFSRFRLHDWRDKLFKCFNHFWMINQKMNGWGVAFGYKNILPGANRNINISKSGVGVCQQLHDRKLFYCILVRKPYCAVKYVSVRFQTLYTEAEQC